MDGTSIRVFASVGSTRWEPRCVRPRLNGRRAHRWSPVSRSLDDDHSYLPDLRMEHTFMSVTEYRTVFVWHFERPNKVAMREMLVSWKLTLTLTLGPWAWGSTSQRGRPPGSMLTSSMRPPDPPTHGRPDKPHTSTRTLQEAGSIKTEIWIRSLSSAVKQTNFRHEMFMPIIVLSGYSYFVFDNFS